MTTNHTTSTRKTTKSMLSVEA